MVVLLVVGLIGFFICKRFVWIYEETSMDEEIPQERDAITSEHLDLGSVVYENQLDIEGISEVDEGDISNCE